MANVSFNPSTEVKVFTRLCDEVGTPLAYKAGLLIRDGKWMELLNLRVEPSQYSSAEWYLRDAQIAAFLKKFPFLPIDPGFAEAKAVNSFFEAEKACFWTNERLSPLLSDLGHYGEGVRRYLVAWRKEIRRVLRKAPSLQSLQGKFGPGSTFLNRGDMITLADKLSENYTATRQTLATFSSVWDETAWSRYAACGLDTDGTDFVSEQCGQRLYSNSTLSPRDFEVVGGNRFTTVEKTALTRRGICIEPSLNVFYQLSVGSVLTSRMKYAYGWDKGSIQQLHRSLARASSITEHLATIDLSSASDTVCKNLVKLLLPRDWYDLLYQLRSHSTFIQGRWLRLEKFSSMGNGYTFELETLIFRTLCETLWSLSAEGCDTVKGQISVFGDDIIVPTGMARDVISCLQFFGFSVNRDKTFLDGPFRESCGGDYYRGSDVRPFYLRKALDAPHRIIACINGLKRYRDRLSNCCSYDDRSACVPWLVSRLPRQIRKCRGPAELGDLVITTEDPRLWDTVVRNSVRYLRVWRPVTNRPIGYEHFRPGVVNAYALYRAGISTSTKIDTLLQLESGSPDLGVIPRINGSYVQGYRFGRTAFS